LILVERVPSRGPFLIYYLLEATIAAIETEVATVVPQIAAITADILAVVPDVHTVMPDIAIICVAALGLCSNGAE
jgi:hypothetical protein